MVDRQRRVAIARHRLKMMLKETPTRKRRTFRRRLGTSLGYKGSPKNRADQVTSLASRRRGRMTDKRIQKINAWYRRRALGQVDDVSVPDVEAREYFILNDNERFVIPKLWHLSHVSAGEFEEAPNIWTIPPPPTIIINTVAHIRAFSFGIIDAGGQNPTIGASFMIPWGSSLVNAVGDDIRDLFKKFNGVIYDAFLSPPPEQGYSILALAFSNLGAITIADEYDSEVDGQGYGIFLESRRRPKGQVYQLKEVSDG